MWWCHLLARIGMRAACLQALSTRGKHGKACISSDHLLLLQAFQNRKINVITTVRQYFYWSQQKGSKKWVSEVYAWMLKPQNPPLLTAWSWSREMLGSLIGLNNIATFRKLLHSKLEQQFYKLACKRNCLFLLYMQPNPDLDLFHVFGALCIVNIWQFIPLLFPLKKHWNHLFF